MVPPKNFDQNAIAKSKLQLQRSYFPGSRAGKFVLAKNVKCARNVQAAV